MEIPNIPTALILTRLLNKVIAGVYSSEDTKHLPREVEAVGFSSHTRRLIFRDVHKPEMSYQIQQLHELPDGMFTVTNHPAGHHCNQYTYTTTAESEAVCLRQLSYEISRLARIAELGAGHGGHLRTSTVSLVSDPVENINQRILTILQECPYRISLDNVKQIGDWLAIQISTEYGRAYRVELSDDGDWNAIPVIHKPKPPKLELSI